MSASSEVIVDLLTCPICESVPDYGGLLQCPNDHLICEKCHIKLRPRKVCPSCRSKYEEVGGRPKRSRLINPLLDTVELPCKYKDEGCDVRMIRGELWLHELECDFAPTECRFWADGCPVKRPRLVLAEHEEICVFKHPCCRWYHHGCPTEVAEDELEAHEADCEYQEVECPFGEECKGTDGDRKMVCIQDLRNHLSIRHRHVFTFFSESEGHEEVLDLQADSGDQVRFAHLEVAETEHEFLSVVAKRGGCVRAYVVFLGSPSSRHKSVHNFDIILKNQADREIMIYSGPCNAATNKPEENCGITTSVEACLEVAGSTGRMSVWFAYPPDGVLSERQSSTDCVGDLEKHMLWLSHAEVTKLKVLNRRETARADNYRRVAERFRFYAEESKNGLLLKKRQEKADRALFEAVKRQDVDAAQGALRNNADANYRWSEGRFANHSPLFKACSLGDLTMVKLLLDSGADANDKNKFGDTALHWAVKGGSLQVVKEIVEKTSFNRLSHANLAGKTAEDWAEGEIEEYLKTHE